METIIYGDSFSNSDACRCTAEQMWFAQVFDDTNNITDRTKSQNNVDTMFLQATHDCVTHSAPTRMVIALGPLQRLGMYTDGWYESERLLALDGDGRPHDLADCQQYFSSFTVDHVNRHTQNLFHPTYLWAKLYSDILRLDALCARSGHRLLVLHMSVTKRPYNTGHPLVAPLERAMDRARYINEEHSCTRVCEQAGIRPWDYDRYGWIGHHSAEGQAHFGRHIRSILQSWN
jgi:hypothetical protein